MFAHLRRSVSSHPLVADAVLAVVLGVLIGLGAALLTPAGSTTSQEVGWVLVAVAALPLAIRRRNPYLCLIAVFALTIAGHAISTPFPPVILPAAVALYSVGTRASGRTALLVVGGSLVIAVGLAFASSEDEGIARSLVFELAWVIGALAVGFAVASRRAYVDQMRQRALLAERTKEEEAQRRVDEERMRIARDVHDGVAHALASISIQAGAGSAVLDGDTEAARQVFSDIRAASGSALAELRSTLRLLRHQDGAAEEGMDRGQVERLVAVLRAEGIRVRLNGDPSEWNVRGDVGVALHRILQESLTNILRHSGADEVEIILRRTGKDIVLFVGDNGQGTAQGPGETRGYGLLGMRERASLLAGTVESGPRRGGGFEVRATFPITGDS
ncbi:MAG: sensor histidine kinase [Armatimonadetes bacterium]|nr:sensor histidine kinase [Armatimonadota bacterium]